MLDIATIEGLKLIENSYSCMAKSVKNSECFFTLLRDLSSIGELSYNLSVEKRTP